MIRYRMTSDGERRVYASKRRLHAMGREWARLAHANGVKPVRVGNLEHDRACEAEFKFLTENKR